MYISDTDHARKTKTSNRFVSGQRPAKRQERRLKNESQADRKKIEAHWSKHSDTQLTGRVHDCGEKTDCRNDEEIAIHRDSLL